MNDLSATVSCPPSGEGEVLLADFTSYLLHERALASTTVENYLNQVRPFVTGYCGGRTRSLTALRIGDVDDLLTWRAQTCSAGSVMVAATGLRALLRWMFLAGLVDQQLAPAIGPVRYSAHGGMPKSLPAADVATLIPGRHVGQGSCRGVVVGTFGAAFAGSCRIETGRY